MYLHKINLHGYSQRHMKLQLCSIIHRCSWDWGACFSGGLLLLALCWGLWYWSSGGRNVLGGKQRLHLNFKKNKHFFQSSQSHCHQGSHGCAVTSFVYTGKKDLGNVTVFLKTWSSQRTQKGHMQYFPLAIGYHGDEFCSCSFHKLLFFPRHCTWHVMK